MSDKILRQPVTLPLSGKVIPNRFYRSALSEFLGTHGENLEDNGEPTLQYSRFFQELAAGEVGLICFGNIPVHRDYLQAAKNVILDPNQSWDAVEAFRPPIKAAKSMRGICLPQLTFPGRQVPEHLNARPKSASDVQLQPCLNMSYGKPEALKIDEIKDLIQRFVWAAETLAKAGADGVTLHASHGYLFSQFLSPLTNQRKDEYGGNLENRARFLLEVVAAIKSKLPTDQHVIAIKYNCLDFVEGGPTFSDQCTVFKWLEDAGVDFFDITGGTYASPAWRGLPMDAFNDFPPGAAGEGFFLKWAKEFKKISTRAIVGTTGGWRDVEHMSRAVANGAIDMCGLGRPLQDDPQFVKNILAASSNR